MTGLASYRRHLKRLVARSGVRPIQTAALPWRRTLDGKLEVLLVTDRKGWIIPKGWPMLGKTLAEAAAQEAWEEAGVRGHVERRSLGDFRHDKKLPFAGRLRVNVRVYPLAVETELGDWPERAIRTRCWHSPDDAADKVRSRKLAILIRSIADHLGRAEG